MILVHLLQLLLNDLRLRATCMLLCEQPLTLPEMCSEIHFVWVQHDGLSATPVLIAYRLTVATVLSPFNQMHEICPVRWRCNKRPFHLPTWTASEGKRLRTIAENSGTKEVTKDFADIWYFQAAPYTLAVLLSLWSFHDLTKPVFWWHTVALRSPPKCPSSFKSSAALQFISGIDMLYISLYSMVLHGCFRNIPTRPSPSYSRSGRQHLSFWRSIRKLWQAKTPGARAIRCMMNIDESVTIKLQSTILTQLPSTLSSWPNWIWCTVHWPNHGKSKVEVKLHFQMLKRPLHYRSGASCNTGLPGCLVDLACS
jgi:hypothetical protein